MALAMANDEIVVRYKQAKDKGAQVKILADLNACPVERIIGILTANGIDSRNFNRLRGKLKKEAEQKADKPEEERQKKPYKKPEIIPVPPAKEPEPEAVSVPKAFETLFNRVSELLKQKEEVEKQRENIVEELAQIDVMLNRIEDYIAGRGEKDESTEA